MLSLNKYFRKDFPYKKALLTFLVISCFPVLKANPIITPPIITELYFAENGWQMEMVFDYMYGIDNLDNVRLVGLYDTALFNQGITVNTGEIMVITENDLQSPFFIDSLGDDITLETGSGSNWVTLGDFGIYFGECNGYHTLPVTAPIGYESVAYQEFYHYDGNHYSYWLVKEKPQTIGSSAFNIQKRALFQGYVFDMEQNPIPNVKLDYCFSGYYYSASPTVPLLVTNEDGYFYTEFMFSRKYHIIFRDNYEVIIGDTIISVECDSNNYFEFVLDSIWVGLNDNKPVQDISFYNFPNPFSERTKIVADLHYNPGSSKAIVKIYNLQGELLKILPLEKSFNPNRFETSFELSETQLKPGTFLYTLEIDHKKVASNKMIVIP